MEIRYRLEDINAVVKQILKNLKTNIVLLDAPMGSGKTTLVAALCSELGVEDPVSSPTFAICNEYKGANLTIFHFDLYRIKDFEELVQMGFEDYFYRPNTLILIEWPEISTPLLGSHDLICIFSPDNQHRSLTLKEIK